MKFEIEKIKNKTAIISLAGRLVGEFQTVSLTEEIDELIEENVNQIVFDLSALDYINSTGLGFFLKSLTKVRRQDGEIILCSLNALLETLLVTTKLSSFFTICKNKDEAIIYLSKQKA